MIKILKLSLFIVVVLGINPLLSAERGEIVVGTMDVVKNLNPYLAQSEIESALQKVVFPSLIADFIEMKGKKEEGDSFRGILITDRDFDKKGSTDYLDFTLNGSRITPGIFIENFKRIKSLGTKSNFSWNLERAESPGPYKVRAFFEKKYLLGKLIASSFPLVDFNSIDERWQSSEQVFITNSDRNRLKGFSDYRYSSIDSRNSIINVSPVATGKNLVVKSFPDYKQLIDRLNAGELQAAFNLSALTQIYNKEIALDDMKFANQYVLYMIVTQRGVRRGLADMDIINNIRHDYRSAFSRHPVLQSSGHIYRRSGFLLEDAQLPQPEQLEKLDSVDTITLLYYRNTINDYVKEIIEGIIRNMGYSLYAVAIDRNTSRDKINMDDFDFVIESRYIQFPEFLNLKYYKEYMGLYPAAQAQGELKKIEQLLSEGGKLSSLHEEAQKLENSLLKNIPIVFFLRYNTRIAVRRGTQNYQSDKGVPYFFYNLSKW